MIFLDFSGKNAYTVSHQRQRRGGVDASGKPREEPGGARLRFPGVEGRPRAAKLNRSRLRRFPRYGTRVRVYCPNSGGTADHSALRPKGFGAVFVGGKGNV